MARMTSKVRSSFFLSSFKPALPFTFLPDPSPVSPSPSATCPPLPLIILFLPTCPVPSPGTQNLGHKLIDVVGHGVWVHESWGSADTHDREAVGGPHCPLLLRMSMVAKPRALPQARDNFVHSCVGLGTDQHPRPRWRRPQPRLTAPTSLFLLTPTPASPPSVVVPPAAPLETDPGLRSSMCEAIAAACHALLMSAEVTLLPPLRPSPGNTAPLELLPPGTAEWGCSSALPWGFPGSGGQLTMATIVRVFPVPAHIPERKGFCMKLVQNYRFRGSEQAGRCRTRWWCRPLRRTGHNENILLVHGTITVQY